jgi:hypothetical protein
MKLKEFNVENTVSERYTPVQVPALGINVKSGLFRLNKAAAELIGAKVDELVVLHQDEEEPTDWYIEKVKEKGFKLRFKDNVGSGLFFNSAPLAKAIADSVEFNGKGGKVLVAGKPTDFQKRKLFGLLTGGLKNT